MERKQVCLWRIIRRLGLLWLALPLGFAVVTGGVAISLGAQVALLARDGVTADAEVLGRELVRRRDSDGKEQISYYLEYRYSADGRADPIKKRQSVSRALYQQTREGDVIPVTYAWTQPERASVDLRHDRTALYVFGAFGAISALVSLGVGWWMLRRKISVIRALRHGEVREARVTDLRRTTASKNRRTQYVLDWVDATGAKGTSMMDHEDAFAGHGKGSVIVVYVDPKTGRGWWDAQF